MLHALLHALLLTSLLVVCVIPPVAVLFVLFKSLTRRTAYWVAVVLFVLTMFSKTSIVMLPLLLLLCVWWERGWTVKLNWREVMLFTATQAAAIAGLASIYLLWKLSTPFEPLGFLAALAGLILAGFLFVYLYKRLAPMWREMVDFQGSQFVFLLWCGGFILMLAWLGEYWQTHVAVAHKRSRGSAERPPITKRCGPSA